MTRLIYGVGRSVQKILSHRGGWYTILIFYREVILYQCFVPSMRCEFLADPPLVPLKYFLVTNFWDDLEYK